MIINKSQQPSRANARKQAKGKPSPAPSVRRYSQAESEPAKR